MLLHDNASQSSALKGSQSNNYGMNYSSASSVARGLQQQQPYGAALQTSNGSQHSPSHPSAVQYYNQQPLQPSIVGSSAPFVESNGYVIHPQSPHQRSPQAQQLQQQYQTILPGQQQQFPYVPSQGYSGAQLHASPSTQQQQQQQQQDVPLSSDALQHQLQQQQALLTSRFESQVQHQQTNALQSIRALAASASAPALPPPSPEGLHPFVFQYKSTKYELDHCLALLQALNLEIAAVKKNTSVLQKMVGEHHVMLKKYGAAQGPPPQTFAPPIVPPSASERQRISPPPTADAESKPLEHITNGSPRDQVDVYLNAFIQTRPDLNLRIVKKDPPLYLLNNQEAFIAMREGIVSIRDGLGWTPFNDFIAEATGAAQQQLQEAAKRKKAPLKKKKAPLKKKKAPLKKKSPSKAKKPSATTKGRTLTSASATVAKKRTANLSIKRIAAQRSAAKKK